MVLSKRLQKIADFIPEGSSVADVGTDHGYIPIWLAQQHKYGEIYASDIHKSPLLKAMENATLNDAAEKIRFLLCPGLECYPPNAVETILIAGMGGDTIMDILRTSSWALNKCLVLQPQTKIPELRTFLFQHGISIADAALVREGGHMYVIWQCFPAAEQKHELWETYIDEPLLRHRDVLLPEYITALMNKMQVRLYGLKMAEQYSMDEITYCETGLSVLKTLWEETQSWQK